MSFSLLVINPGYFNNNIFEIIEKNYMILLHEKKWLKFVILFNIGLKELFLFFVSFTFTVNDNDNKIAIIYQNSYHLSQVHNK